MFPFGIAVTVQRQTEDKFGNWSTASTHTIAGCGIDYTGSSELTSGQETVTRQATLYAPAGSDLVSTDFVLLPDGSRWSVVGHVADFTNPLTGWNPGMTVQLQRVTG